MSESPGDSIIDDVDHIHSAASTKSLTGITRTISDGRISNLKSNAISLDSTLESTTAVQILNELSNGTRVVKDTPTANYVCDISERLESKFQYGGGRNLNLNKEQINHNIGVKQKVQVGGTEKNDRLLVEWLDKSRVIFNESYVASECSDDPVRIAVIESTDDYTKLKNLHIFLKLLILKTILQKTRIHLMRKGETNSREELLKRICVQVDIYFGEFDVAAAMFIVFCGTTALQQFGTLSVITACGYSATYAPQICSLFFKVMNGPVTDLVSWLFDLGGSTIIASFFAVKSITKTITSHVKELESPKFPRPVPPSPTLVKQFKQVGDFLINFVFDMSPVAAATLPNLSNFAQTMFSTLAHIKHKASDALLNPVIRLFLDTFTDSDRIYVLARTKPIQFGLLLTGIVSAVEVQFPGKGKEIEHRLQSSQLSSYHAHGTAASTHRSVTGPGDKVKSSIFKKGGSTSQNMTKSTLKNRNAIKTMNKRYNRFRFHVSKNNSMLYKNRHRLLTSKNRKNKK